MTLDLFGCILYINSAADRRLAKYKFKSNLFLGRGGYFFLCILMIATISMATPMIIVNSSYVEILSTSLPCDLGFSP